jgi:hypothetical protein
MHVAARVRLVLARHPALYWAAVLLAAAGAAGIAASAGAAVDDARRAWGETRAVVVATGDLAPGDPLAGATERRSLPGPLVPPTAVDRVDQGSTARQRIAAGEIVVRSDVAPTAAPQALIPAGWSAVAVAEAVPTGVRTGDAVTAVAGGVMLSADGLVVGSDAGTVLVAVPDDAVPSIAAAAADGTLMLALVPAVSASRPR